MLETPPPKDPPRRATPHHTMKCMEIWGGTGSYENSVSFPGIDAWIYSQPFHADEAGGDIHYMSMCGEGKIGRFILADVSGHGISVSKFGSILRKLVRKSISNPDQTVIAQRLNRTVARLSTDGTFATAVIMTYFGPTDQLVCCLAGHPQPLLYRASTKQWGWLRPGTQEAQSFQGFPLGILHPTNYEQFVVSLDRDDLIIAYTDALIESHAKDAEPLGEEGLLAVAASLDASTPETFGRALISKIDQLSGDTPTTRNDDLTLLVLHHNAVDPKPVSLGHKLRMMMKMMGI